MHAISQACFSTLWTTIFFFPIIINFNKSTFKITDVKSTSATDYTISGDLTIKGITKPVSFPVKVAVSGNKMTATGTIKFDRTNYDIKYRSGNFFTDLGDKMIYDEVNLGVKLVATICLDYWKIERFLQWKLGLKVFQAFFLGISFSFQYSRIWLLIPNFEYYWKSILSLKTPYQNGLNLEIFQFLIFQFFTNHTSL